jgi:hypothetical protein
MQEVQLLSLAGIAQHHSPVPTVILVSPPLRGLGLQGDLAVKLPELIHGCLH